MEPINSAKVKKSKSKKNKSTDNYDKQNINMKKSFSKFDDLQKRSLIHTPMAEQQLDNCHQCQKSVYKMEEVVLHLKTGTKLFHKTCLRCKECSKQLKLESYYAHDGDIYCHMHFKLIFAPKIVYEGIKPQKPELIIRENQPLELPPDVARASDKPNLGLDELQQLNVRSKFEVFENACSQNSNNSQNNCQGTAITHGKSIRSTLNKLHKLGISNLKSEQLKDINDVNLDDESNDVNNDSDYYSQMLTEKERPLGLGEAMNDIRTKFENGEMITKEERREERKQEIQGIRSRLFMGKQAKIKEMYQQAVAESKQGLTSVNKTPDIELTTDTQSIKDRFENGEAFKDTIKMQSKEAIEDAEVFESAISKASRNIFMELDANSASDLDLVSSRIMSSNPTEKLIQSDKKIVGMDTDIVKSDAKPEYVKVSTEELSERFKFFEQFRPVEKKRHIFRITPPREGVVKIDSDTDTDILSSTEQTSIAEDILLKTKTTSTILNKFREMEKNKILDKNNKMKQPKPLKCFTPPPETEINKRFSNNKSDSEDEESFSEDDETNTNEDSDDDKEMYSENVNKSCNRDQALQEAKNAARAKQLCAKFEKWQINEIQRELKEDREDVYSQLISSDSIESAKIIRERFENMKLNGETQMEDNVPRAKINRFV